MIKITDNIFIDDNNLTFQFIRSSGPGGQNVNKVSTAVELRFDLNNETNLSHYLKERLKTIARNRISKEGILIISANEYRSQDQNKAAALDRLRNLIINSSIIPKTRRKTHPSRSSNENRISSKKINGRNKSYRQNISFCD